MCPEGKYIPSLNHILQILDRETHILTRYAISIFQKQLQTLSLFV